MVQRFTQDLGGAWECTPSIDEQWRFPKLHLERTQPVGAFARTEWIPAQVPGSVHHDLRRAGLIEDYRVGLNSLSGEWVSARQWVYRRLFRLDLPAGGRTWLQLAGVDHACEVYLNGEKLGETRGAFAVTRFRLPEMDRTAEHLLVIVLYAPPAEQGQLGRTSLTKTLKPRYGYWWDFCTRLIDAGITQPVTLEWDAGAALLDVYPQIELSDDLKTALVRAQVELDGTADLSAILTYPDGKTEVVKGGGDDLHFTIPDPQLWWPRGLGGQPLYQLSVTAEGCAPVPCRFGLRRARLVHNAASRARGALSYTLEINGQALYARGFNVLPVDMLAGLPENPARERQLIQMAADANANLLRFNGVAPIATKTVLDTCDELGLLVWQEMPLTSSGTDNVPPALDAFREVLDRELPPILRRLRSHPCVVLLDAGNELTNADRSPADAQNPTIAHIHDLMRSAGLDQPFLPTSPSGPTYDLDEQVARHRPHDLHDVHGPWHYRGASDSYRPHALNRALMHSEFGCQAPPRRRTLSRYLRQPWPMDDRVPEVVHHGEWWLMRHRIEEVFGPLPDLRRYVLLGQAVQGDVLRHALNWNRSRLGECSAALVWQLNEPWPNAHNTSLLDYDLSPKLAYYRCREANAPHAIHLGLERPVGNGTVTLRPQILADQAGSGWLEWQQFDLHGKLLCTDALEVTWPTPGLPLDISLTDAPTLLRAHLTDRQGLTLAHTEQWLAPDRPHPFRALLNLPETRLTLSRVDGHLHVCNEGRSVTPWVSLEALEEGWERFEDNGFTLLPGESRSLKAALRDGSGRPRPAAFSVQAVNAAPFTFRWERE